MSTISRWAGGAPGRSRSVRHADTIYTVANARQPSAPFVEQVTQSLAMLDAHLREAGSSRSRILSLQVLLADIAQRPEFDRHWVEWIGADPAHWPQRACFQAALAPGLLIELIVVAAAEEPLRSL
ncbi:Rid family hydrolase [Scleromatobacter humisilvae]|uniref:RidA family protein n=1 Tax=Scleromatobacter humisilvae TaxID=2897159 RepID=A0A9X2C0E1_9BURK|nr:Rid family hydrolase [Scleromatobacter humisilvae]MCK9684664.1 RidA family protein [Scleromatobacter humisilvae]